MTTSAGCTLTAVGQCIIKEDILASTAQDFQELLTLTRGSDFCFTSMEGTIQSCHGGWPMKPAKLTHASDPLVLDCLKSMGFNVLSLVNNHAWDLGAPGILSAIAEANARGIPHAGIGADLQSATRPAISVANGCRVGMVAMDAGPQGDHVYATDATPQLAARPGCNPLNLLTTLVVSEDELATVRAMSEKLNHETRKQSDRKVGYRQMPGEGFEFYGLRFVTGSTHEERREPVAEDVKRNLDAIAETAQRADFVIAYIHHHHWEPRWEIPPRWFQQFAEACVDAGAHMVVSHGVPMLQGMALYKGAPLFYGLGNFIFHTWQARRYEDERIWQSVVAKVRFDGKAVSGIEIAPIVLGGQRALETADYDARRVPHLARGAYGEKILQRFAGMSAPFGTRINITGDRATVLCGGDS